MQGDTDQAIDFLKRWAPDSLWVLHAVDPERKKGLVAATFDAASEADARRWINNWNGIRNVYYMVNAAKQRLNTKADKEHVGWLMALHVDIDPLTPPEGADPVAHYAQEGESILGRLRAYTPPPSVIVFSGGGYQGLWLLSQPVDINGPEDIAKAEAYNRKLERDLGGDHCHNVDRIMRLPGTVNVPDAKKRRKGRTEQLARVVEATWAAHDLSSFTPLIDDAPSKVGAKRSHWIMRVLKNGPDKGGEHAYGGDRSKALWAVCCGLVRRGWTPERITAAILDKANRISDHVHDQSSPEKYAKRQVEKAFEAAASDGVTIEDFWAYMPAHTYIYTPTRDQWPAASVNARLPKVPLFAPDGSPIMEVNKKGETTEEQATMAPSVWLDKNRPVEQMTWAPGEEQVIPDRLVAIGGWFSQPGVSCFNLYKAPTIEGGDPAKAGPWVDHVRTVYPDDATHIIRYMAQRVQDPACKINHALVLGGEPGIGKDTTLEPVKQAVGPWNFQEIVPQHLLGNFNSFAKSVILRISEARDLEINRYQFYEHTKVYTAAPPDTLRCNEKYSSEYPIINCCGVVITTNYKTNGIYLPANDRRHYVAWSDKKKEDFDEGYWRELWRWYDQGGFGHVAAYLGAYDLEGFDPKEPPPKTSAFWEIVDSNRSPEDSELDQILEDLGYPLAITVEELVAKSNDEFASWLRDRKNRRALPHRFEQCGYSPTRNEAAKDGLWKVRGHRMVIYTKVDLAVRDRIEAARDHAGVVVNGHAQNTDIPF